MLGDIRCAGREASRALFLAPDMPEAWEMRARCILTQVQWLFYVCVFFPPFSCCIRVCEVMGRFFVFYSL
jgi:hypothetical protein